MAIQLLNLHSLSAAFVGCRQFLRFSTPICFHPHKHRVITTRIVVSSTASATSSSSFSASDFSGQLLDVGQRLKNERVAGTDQDELLDPALLADPDSNFCEFRGVHIHHKVCDAESKAQNPLENSSVSQLPQHTKRVGIPMILLHGFGASLFSWNRVMKSLAEVCGSKVIAFDRPAFGLTSRVSFPGYQLPGDNDTKPLNPYSLAFSVLATLYFIDFLAVEKAILVGHSAGSLVAVDSYFEAPERVAALILIAPAIFSPATKRKATNSIQSGVSEQTTKDSSKSNLRENPLIGFSANILKLFKYISQAIMQIVKQLAEMIGNLYRKALAAVLRSAFAVMLIRTIINKFGVAAIKNAWYDPSQVTDHVLSGYTKPLRTKNWDRALAEYTACMLTDSGSKSKPPLEKRLHEISCPVLIVTGDSDRLVPSWNAERLSRVIPNSCFEIIKQCGHLPHEEKADEFVSIVKKFLQRYVYNSKEQHKPAST